MHQKRVFFFLSAGWGPAVRTLPIMRGLADHGISSSFAMGETAGATIRAAGFDLIELSLPAFNVPASEIRDWWSPYHYLAFHRNDIDPLIHRVDASRKAISDGRPAAMVTDINPVAALAARSLQVPHITISQSKAIRSSTTQLGRTDGIHGSHSRSGRRRRAPRRPDGWQCSRCNRAMACHGVNLRWRFNARIACWNKLEIAPP